MGLLVNAVSCLTRECVHVLVLVKTKNATSTKKIFLKKIANSSHLVDATDYLVTLLLLLLLHQPCCHKHK